MSATQQLPTLRADAARNRERILDAAERMLERSPSATLTDIAAAAGIARSTLHRRFPDRDALLAALRGRAREPATETRDGAVPPGRLGRDRPVTLDAIHVFDVVPPPALPEQLVAEAQRIAQVPVALYVLDIDGSHLLHMAGPRRLGDQLEAPLAVGPELDADGLSELRERLGDLPGAEVYALWLRGRANGVLIAFGRPAEPLGELARQAGAAITLSDRYTDAFALAQRRKQPKAAAEIQQSLLPPRIMRISGGEVAGNVLPSYEVAGDWFDVVENAEGVWISLANGLGGSTRAAASSAVALGALRASRRSGGDIAEALVVMHQTLRELPGPRSEMTAIVTRWEPMSSELRVANCGQAEPLIVRADGRVEVIPLAETRGLGGRTTAKPVQGRTTLAPGDRMILVSDGVTSCGKGQACLGVEGVERAALRSQRGTAADTVREIHTSVLAAARGKLADDATVVCLSVY